MERNLYHDSVADAMREVIAASGGVKVVGAMMFPAMPVDHAASRIRDCLNPDRRERFSPEELMLIIRIGRNCGCHALITHLARDGGYADPQPVDLSEEKARLQRDFIEATKALHAMASRIEAITATAARRVA